MDSEEGAKFEATFDVDFLVRRKDVVCEHVPGRLRISPWMQATKPDVCRRFFIFKDPINASLYYSLGRPKKSIPIM